MRVSFRQKLEEMETKLFSISMASLFCSFLFAIVFKIYATFVFKPHYYRSLTPPQQQAWWFKLINSQQAAELLRTPSAQILLVLTLLTAFIGFGLMGISLMRNKDAERKSNERIQQWLNENPPTKKHQM